MEVVSTDTNAAMSTEIRSMGSPPAFMATVVGRQTICHFRSGDVQAHSGKVFATRFSGWREIRVLVV
jgi:hypothetical protein